MLCNVLVKSISRGRDESTITLLVKVLEGEPNAMMHVLIPLNSSITVHTSVIGVAPLDDRHVTLTLDCEEPGGAEILEMLNLVDDTFVVKDGYIVVISAAVLRLHASNPLALHSWVT